MDEPISRDTNNHRSMVSAGTNIYDRKKGGKYAGALGSKCLSYNLYHKDFNTDESVCRITELSLSPALFASEIYAADHEIKRA